jgi:hypothetical protein
MTTTIPRTHDEYRALRAEAVRIGLDPRDVAATPNASLEVLVNSWRDLKPYLVEDADIDEPSHPGAVVLRFPVASPFTLIPGGAA